MPDGFAEGFNYYMFIVESINPDRLYGESADRINAGKLLIAHMRQTRFHNEKDGRDEEGEDSHDCYSSRCCWCIKSRLSMQPIIEILHTGNIVHLDDRFLLAPLSGPWLTQHARSADDCFG